MNKRQAAVIGAGASGLVLGGFAARGGLAVTILDKNARPARKVLITGKGRCNVTNDCTPEEFLTQVRTNPRFLYGAIHTFSPADAIAFFEGLGVPLKTERGRRVFPQSDKAADIVDALSRFARDNGALLRPKTRAMAIQVKDGAVDGVVLEDGSFLKADAIAVATGGLSYPRTGSDGDGYRIAQSVGHTIVQQRPSLVPLVLRDKWCAELMGLSLRNVTLTLTDKKGKKVFSELGEMLFTHFGISGPLVLSASAYISGEMQDYRLSVNLKPALTPPQLDARILRDFAEQQNKDFGNALDGLLPRRMIPVLIRLSGIPEETKVHSVTREQRLKLVSLLQELPLSLKGFGAIEEAVITSGGVSVKEINPKTMESKLVKGLFFAGEVIDVDAFTGGYNLQIAYSTAYAAAQGMINKVSEGTI